MGFHPRPHPSAWIRPAWPGAPLPLWSTPSANSPSCIWSILGRLGSRPRLSAQVKGFDGRRAAAAEFLSHERARAPQDPPKASCDGHLPRRTSDPCRPTAARRSNGSVLEARHPTSNPGQPHRPAGTRSRRRAQHLGAGSADRPAALDHRARSLRPDGRPPLGEGRRALQRVHPTVTHLFYAQRS